MSGVLQEHRIHQISLCTPTTDSKSHFAAGVIDRLVKSRFFESLSWTARPLFLNRNRSNTGSCNGDDDDEGDDDEDKLCRRASSHFSSSDVSVFFHSSFMFWDERFSKAEDQRSELTLGRRKSPSKPLC